MARDDDSSTGGIDVSSGHAELLADADRPGGWLLLVDRVRQSYVDLNHPTYLDLEYVQHLADIVDALPPGELAVTHIGGGAFCFPRYLAATRPGSPQIVFEPDERLTEFIRARLPFARNARVRVRPQGGQEGVAALKTASADVIVLDAFLGARVPAELTTAEFVDEVARVLRPGGTYVANLADGPPLTYLRRVVATIATRLPNVLLVSDPAVLKGRRYGNVVLAASTVELPLPSVRRSAAAAMFPVQVLTGTELTRFVGQAKPLTDADSLRSAEPPGETWRAGEY
ncbi:hypothetical protein SAMN05892883_3541 [Jatrophihabitans sp. GAS493]|uniref:spermidine synthase n=1 Tax=Jatrophihabitans sp. GAS493 TaxID=1907575 RepID=UPI000BB98195|nr:fused MFS/spermidine synthase [Jatrophihabitans sp. GAS493]SOD74357.1 hypothetical protein SAMN05892883_3541 [Jatrophihabitans sp. GAS493]